MDDPLYRGRIAKWLIKLEISPVNNLHWLAK